MSTSVYAIKFNSGKRCTCICMEPASDEENEASIRDGFCGKVESVAVINKRSEEDE